MTDKKSPPSGKEEVTDVLSSIRRLVSDELRERSSRKVPSGPGVLSLDNDLPASGPSSPLLLSEQQSQMDDLRPDPPLTGPRPSGVFSADRGQERPDAAEEMARAERPHPSLGPTRPSGPRSGTSEIGFSVDRVRPLKSDGTRLPKPIRPGQTDGDGPGDGPVVDDPVVSEREDIAPAAEPTTDEVLASAGKPDDTGTSETPQAEPPEPPARRPRTEGPRHQLDAKLSSFALASLNKPGQAGPQPEARDNAAAASGTGGKPALINPFARNKGDSGDRQDYAGLSDATPAAGLHSGEGAPGPSAADEDCDPEFESFQSAEKAFAELAEAKASLGGQATFSSLQSVIQSSGVSVSGRVVPSAPGADGASAPSDSADAAAKPAPFFDEAELRQIVTEIVRDELAGELGEKLSRNIRKIIRREIALALSDDDGPGILND